MHRLRSPANPGRGRGGQSDKSIEGLPSLFRFLKRKPLQAIRAASTAFQRRRRPQWARAVEFASPRGAEAAQTACSAGRRRLVHGTVSNHPSARGASTHRRQIVAVRQWLTSGWPNDSSTPAAKVLEMASNSTPALVAPRQRRCCRALPWAAMRFLGAVAGSCRLASAFEALKDRPTANPLSMMC